MNPSTSPSPSNEAVRVVRDRPECQPPPALLGWLEAQTRPLRPTRLVPRAFFVARSGVLTLAFTGFPASLLRLKKELEGAFPHLASEAPGSRWPKVTLAAPDPECPLTRSDLDVLLHHGRAWTPRLADLPALPVDALTVVSYGCRSLEERLAEHRLPLEGGPPDPTDEPPPEHRAYVEHVLAQLTPEHLERYAPALLGGTHDANHYRRPHPGSTLVYDLPSGSLPVLDAFLDAIEDALPGRYVRFTPESRHVTLRRLTPFRT